MLLLTNKSGSSVKTAIWPYTIYFVLTAFMLMVPGGMVFASNIQAHPDWIDLTQSRVGFAAVLIFVVAYVFVILEEHIHLKKSKPVLIAASLIWILIAIAYLPQQSDIVKDAIKHNFIEYAELFFFLLVAMTYINAMLERRVFDALRQWLVKKGFGYQQLFWLTGVLSFLMSPIADNLTTALIMCAVVMAVGKAEPKFIALGCINIVVAANAGGAFSPFGDITTLMVWQKGLVDFFEFFALLIPALVNYIVPAIIFSFALPKGAPKSESLETVEVAYGGFIIIGMFLLTIATVVVLHTTLHLPAVFGMMTGLGYLKLFGYYLKKRSDSWQHSIDAPPGTHNDPYDFDVFTKIAQAEWDTLFFFYGVILSVGGLGMIGYLDLVSHTFYGELGPTFANIAVGVLSSIVDNIPVMFAVLTMQPEMSHNQWLLVTLTAGVGGSLLSVGSAAGVALMGQARGHYTFFSHLKWTPVIALGYIASIATHLLINGH